VACACAMRIICIVSTAWRSTLWAGKFAKRVSGFGACFADDAEDIESILILSF
jgi:hypothetical protein